MIDFSPSFSRLGMMKKEASRRSRRRWSSSNLFSVAHLSVLAFTFTSMHPTAKRQNTISTLDVAVTALDVAEKALGIAPAKAAVSIVKETLAMVRVWHPLLYCWQVTH